MVWDLRIFLLKILLFYLSKPGGVFKVLLITGILCLEVSTMEEKISGWLSISLEYLGCGEVCHMTVDVSISEDKWLPNGELASCKEGCSILSVQDLIDQNVQSWNLSALRENLNPSSAIEALKTPISLTNQRDSFF